MERLLLSLLETSAAVGVIVLALAALSPLLNKVLVARWKYWIWLLLAVRLLIPWNPDLPALPFFSRLPAIQVELPALSHRPGPVQDDAGGGREAGSPAAPPDGDLHSGENRPSALLSEQAESGADPLRLLSGLWLGGLFLFLTVHGAVYLRGRRRLLRWSRPPKGERGGALLVQKRRVMAELGLEKRRVALKIQPEAGSPMVLGLFRPVLLLPTDQYEDGELYYILKHELTHFRRRDLWYKLLLLLANALHWFNPAAYLLFRQAGRDLELSCDAQVVEGAGPELRRQYSEAILSAVRRQAASSPSLSPPLSTHFYRGVSTMRERFANILSDRKRRRGTVAFLAVVLAAALGGSLVACTVPRVSQDGREPSSLFTSASTSLGESGSSSLSQAGSPQAQGSSTVINTGALLEGMESSVLYREAVQMGGVIVANDLPVTDYGPVVRFLESARAGREDSFCLFCFRRSDYGGVPAFGCYMARFTTRDGGMTVEENDVPGWGLAPAFPHSYSLDSCYLSDYGRLVYTTQGATSPSSAQVVPLEEIIDHYSEKKELYDRYLAPIYYTALGGRLWGSPQELGRWIWLFEDLYNYQHQHREDPWQEYGSYWPVEEMAALLSRYFDGVTREMILADNKGAYDEASDSIFYEGGRGGGPLYLRVTGWSQEGDLLSIFYEEYDGETGVPFEDASYLLQIRLAGDGSFRYLSNQRA